MTGRHRARGSDKYSRRRKIDLRREVRQNKGAVLPSYAVGPQRICAVRTRHGPLGTKLLRHPQDACKYPLAGLRETPYHLDAEAWPTVFTSLALLHVAGPRTKERLDTEDKAGESPQANRNAPFAKATWC
jgi:hypothetical protein